MNTQARVGLVTLLVTFLGGIWLFVAPFVVGYQDDWKTLIDATKNDLWSGGALIAVAILTLLLFAAFALRDAARKAVRRRKLRDERKDAGQEG